MNQDRVEGNWLQFKGKVKEQWGKLTDDDLNVIAGKRDQLLGKIQERHRVTLEDAEKQLTSFHERNPTNFFERYWTSQTGWARVLAKLKFSFI